jgi:hypothetical protein
MKMMMKINVVNDRMIVEERVEIVGLARGKERGRESDEGRLG